MSMLPAIPYPPDTEAACSMRLLLFALAAVLAPALALAQTGDPVVAKVGGVPVYKSEVDRQAAEIAPNMQGAPPSAIYQTARERVIDSLLVFAAAEAAGMDQQPDFQRQLTQQRRTLLTQYYMLEYLQERIDDSKIRALYDRTYPGGKGKLEIRASHILVADEETARNVIAELDKGGDFAALAEQHSIGPSKSRGGSLGAFGKGGHDPGVREGGAGAGAGLLHDRPGQDPLRLACHPAARDRTPARPEFHAGARTDGAPAQRKHPPGTSGRAPRRR